ncbi:MAG TPA: hypothetical protein VJ810_40735 [Blastocatellia bacterium]|nr:hypothetical protein [Blastocatellia bacterium]
MNMSIKRIKLFISVVCLMVAMALGVFSVFIAPARANVPECNCTVELPSGDVDGVWKNGSCKLEWCQIITE